MHTYSKSISFLLSSKVPNYVAMKGLNVFLIEFICKYVLWICNAKIVFPQERLFLLMFL